MLDHLEGKSSSKEPLQIGQCVGQRYRIERLLGEDGLGFCYEVSEVGAAERSTAALACRTPLCLRLLQSRVDAKDSLSPALAHWHKQLHLTRQLDHSGIVPVHEVCTTDSQGRVYVVRSAVELFGQPLSTILQARPGGMPEPEAVRLCAAIAEAIEAAHQRGVLHLSLSPQRIFLVSDGATLQVQVADFAVLPPPFSPDYGEPGYSAPEQVEGLPCDRRTDQFSLAVILYEMLSGQPAFIGSPLEDRQTILQRVISEDPLPLALSSPIELALARALSRSRTVRFATVRDFVSALGVDGVAWTVVRPPGPVPSQMSPQPVMLPPYIWRLILGISIVALIGVYFRFGHGIGTRSPRQTAQSQSPSLPNVPPLPPPRPSLMTTGIVTPIHKPIVAAPPFHVPPSKFIRPRPLPALKASTSPPIVDIQMTTDGPPLSSGHTQRIKYCLQLIHPRPPFAVVLENINGLLYVSERTLSPEIKLSSDFRNCLKNEVQGAMAAKDVYIKGMLKGRPVP